MCDWGMNGAGGTIWGNGRISGMQMRQGDWCATWMAGVGEQGCGLNFN